MTSSEKKLAAHNARNLIAADDTAAEKAARKMEEAGVPIEPIDGAIAEIDAVDGDGATGGIGSKHHSPQQARAPPSRMLRFVDVIECTGLSRTTIWRRVKAGTFPAPVQLGANSIGWPELAIIEWVESRPVVAYATEAA